MNQRVKLYQTTSNNSDEISANQISLIKNQKIKFHDERFLFYNSARVASDIF